MSSKWFKASSTSSNRPCRAPAQSDRKLIFRTRAEFVEGQLSHY
jgi:hypothetical protein